MAAQTTGTMKGSITRKPSSTSPASNVAVIRRRNHGAETRSSMVPDFRSAEAGCVGDEHGEGEQHAGGKGQLTAQREMRGAKVERRAQRERGAGQQYSKRLFLI